MATLTKETGLPKASAYRLVSELEELGLVTKSAGLRNRRLMIGPALNLLAYKVVHERTRYTTVSAILRKLANAIGETCTIAVQDADSVVFTESIAPDKPLTFVYPAQSRSPLFCSSSGRIFMAEMNNNLLDRYLELSEREKFTDATVTKADELRKIIAEVKINGYASTYSQWVSNVVGAAVAVRNSKKICIAALSFNAAVTSVPYGSVPDFIPALNQAAIELGGELELINTYSDEAS